MTDFVITNNEKNARKYLYTTAINIGAGSPIVFPSQDLKSPPKKDFTRVVTNKKTTATVGFVSALDQIRTSNKTTQKKNNLRHKKFLPTSNKSYDHKNTKPPQRKTKIQNNRSLKNRKNSFNRTKQNNRNKKSSLKIDLYKTEVCRSWVENGYCKYGEKCQFAHGTSELRKISRHPKYKTQICKPYHQNMFCTYGIRCRFIHTKTQPSSQQPKAITKRLSFFKTITDRNN
ncbi:protein tis11 [Anaeramoeba flamelloides]|uniref:Protein tis11 n=1 Tax=Anaeramoeba flamelloides TaxID=1746091 RepID=A0ABQ8Z099_9EUKA|nr:protein tis11 [Anaeramoeba flamelloides]